MIFIIAALTLSGVRVAAEVDATCCRCGAFFKLTDEGSGFARHHVAFCPKCTAEMGGDVGQYLDKLRGKHQGLADAAQLTLQRLREAGRARDQARDSIYGREGLATDFFKSLLSFAAEGANGTIKTVATTTKKGLDWYNKAADTMESDFTWVGEEGKAWVKDKTVGEAKRKAALKAAAAVGRRYFEQTGDARGATDRFLSANADIKKGVSILEGAIKFYEKTDKLANGIQAYLEARADAERLGKEWDEITDQMQAVQDEITKLEHCLEKQRAQGKSAATSTGFPQGPASRSDVERWTVIWASAKVPTDERAEVQALAFPPNQPDAAALRSALSALQQLRTGLADFRRNLDEEMLPALLPFWLDVQGECGRALAQALLQWAGPVTDVAARQFDRLIRYGDGASEDLQRAGVRPASL